MNELCFLTNVSGEQWAAWVQAIGSVAAIFAAIIIANRQYRDAANLQVAQRHAQRVQIYDAVRAIAEASLEEFSQALTALRGNDAADWLTGTYSETMFSDFYNAVRQVAATDMPSYASVRSLLKFRDLLESAAWNLKTAYDHGDPSLSDFQLCVDCLDHNIAELRTENTKLVAELTCARLQTKMMLL